MRRAADSWDARGAGAKAIVLALCALLLGACDVTAPRPTSSGSLPEPEAIGPICPDRLVLTRDDTPLVVPLCSSRPLSQPDATVRRIVVVIHGDSRNSPDYFRYIVEAAAAAEIDDALVLAPQFLTADDVEAEHLPEDVLYWSKDGWKEGNYSATSPFDRPWRMSSFEVLDQLLADIDESENFPSVTDTVIVGHSAGGQFVNRYAAGSNVGTSGPAVRFVVANPSSYLYLNGDRYDEDADEFSTPRADCSRYDRYKYGLDRRNRYMNALSREELRDRYRERTVSYVLGMLDTGEHDDSLDTSCEARLQGSNRLERGRRFYDYLGTFYGEAVYRTHTLVLVPGVGHDGEAIFNADAVRPVLFPATGE